jgi:hypothetical protein
VTALSSQEWSLVSVNWVLQKQAQESHPCGSWAQRLREVLKDELACSGCFSSCKILAAITPLEL